MKGRRPSFPEERVDLLGDMPERLGGVDGAIVVAEEGIEFGQSFLHQLLFQFALLGDVTRVAPARGGGKGRVEDEELGAEEGEFDVDDCGGHWRFLQLKSPM